jgi:hypothetical protein
VSAALYPRTQRTTCTAAASMERWPFAIGRRLRGTGDLGRVYCVFSRGAAGQAGHPGLLVVPTNADLHVDRKPLAGWRLVLTSSVDPCGFCVEVESAPGMDVPDSLALEEAQALLEDVLDLLALAESRPEMLAHLRTPGHFPLRLAALAKRIARSWLPARVRRWAASLLWAASLAALRLGTAL